MGPQAGIQASDRCSRALWMSDGVVTRLGRDVVNVEGAREMAGHVDSCLRRNDGRGSRNDGRGRRQESRRDRCSRALLMSGGVVTRLGREVVNVEGAREMAGQVDSCLRRNDGRGAGRNG